MIFTLLRKKHEPEHLNNINASRCGAFLLRYFMTTIEYIELNIRNFKEQKLEYKNYINHFYELMFKYYDNKNLVHACFNRVTYAYIEYHKCLVQIKRLQIEIACLKQ